MIWNQLTSLFLLVQIFSSLLAQPIAEDVVFGKQHGGGHVFPGQLVDSSRSQVPVSVFVEEAFPSESRAGRANLYSNNRQSDFAVLGQGQDGVEQGAFVSQVNDVAPNTIDQSYTTINQALPTAFVNNYLGSFVQTHQPSFNQGQIPLPPNQNSKVLESENKIPGFVAKEEDNPNELFRYQQTVPFEQNPFLAFPPNNNAVPNQGAKTVSFDQNPFPAFSSNNNAVQNQGAKTVSFDQNPFPAFSSNNNAVQNQGAKTVFFDRNPFPAFSSNNNALLDHRGANEESQAFLIPNFVSNGVRISNTNNQISGHPQNTNFNLNENNSDELDRPFTNNPNVEQTVIENVQPKQQILNEIRDNRSNKHLNINFFSEINENAQNERENRVENSNDLYSDSTSNRHFNGISDQTASNLGENFITPSPLHGQGFVLRLHPTVVLNNVTSYQDFPPHAFDHQIIRQEDILSQTNTNQIPTEKEKRNSNQNTIFAPINQINQVTKQSQPSSFHVFPKQEEQNTILRTPFPDEKGFIPSHFGQSLVQEESQVVSRGRSLNEQTSQGGRFVPGNFEGGFLPSNFFGALYQNI